MIRTYLLYCRSNNSSRAKMKNLNFKIIIWANLFEKTHKSSQLFTGVFMKTFTTTTFKSPIPWWTFLELSLTALISPTWQIAMFMSDRYQRWDIRSLHFLVSCLILIYIYVHKQYSHVVRNFEMCISEINIHFKLHLLQLCGLILFA